jgi:hypothetical protein
MDDDAWSTRFVAIRGGTANLEMHHSPVDNGHRASNVCGFHHSCCVDGRVSVARATIFESFALERGPGMLLIMGRDNQRALIPSAQSPRRASEYQPPATRAAVRARNPSMTRCAFMPTSAIQVFGSQRGVVIRHALRRSGYRHAVAELVRQIADELDIVISAAHTAHISASGRNLGITMHGRKRTMGERRQIPKLIATIR